MNSETYIGTPGQIARISKEGVTVICGNNKSITILDVEYEGIKTNSDTIIKTINTRLHNYNQLKEDTINYIELPEIKKKIIDYIEEFENLQKRQVMKIYYD